MGIPVLDTILDLVKGPLDKLIVDKNQRHIFKHELEMAVLKAGLVQAEINKEEAKHPSVFVAGWRPAVGWVCALALAWHFVGYDLALWIHTVWFSDSPAPPKLTGTDTLVTLLLSMLGLAVTRTAEKIKGVQRDHWTGNK